MQRRGRARQPRGHEIFAFNKRMGLELSSETVPLTSDETDLIALGQAEEEIASAEMQAALAAQKTASTVGTLFGLALGVGVVYLIGKGAGIWGKR